MKAVERPRSPGARDVPRQKLSNPHWQKFCGTMNRGCRTSQQMAPFLSLKTYAYLLNGELCITK
jgi:hypothetical protein